MSLSADGLEHTARTNRLVVCEAENLAAVFMKIVGEQ
jgi:hypothetical protein